MDPDGAQTAAPSADAGGHDAGPTHDGGTPDGGTPDGGLPDAGTPDAGVPDAGAPDAGTDGGTASAASCPELYAQNLLPTFRVDIAPDEWAKLEDEFLNHKERADAGLDVHPWHPIVFHYNNETFPNAMIRLKGKSSWRLAVERDPDPKMQFVISFNEVHKDGRFRGLRKIVLDMPRNDRTFMRQRLALSYLRDLGITAQCANNARLEINGSYYGLYANLEHLDKEFIQRVFPADDDGDLWKSGYILKTNEESADRQRREALFSADAVAEIDRLVDLDASLRVWAAEAMLPNGDGYYAGTQNFYLYDHPDRGFLWLPYDFDGSFDFVPYDVDPLHYRFLGNKGIHWTIVLSDPVWLQRFEQRLAQSLGEYDVKVLEQRLTTWANQIEQAVRDDPKKPFTFEEHESEVRRMKSFLTQRRDFVHRWLQCRDEGGTDADGDTSPWCFDCSDAEATVYPGAPEVCGNAVDDNCDGQVDDHCG